MNARNMIMVAAVLASIGLAAGTTPVYAAQDEAGNAMCEKLGRGLSNALTGWVEVPYNIEQGMKRSNPVGYAFAGLFKGLAVGVGRTAIGVIETATFWLPVPAGYAPIIADSPYFSQKS